MSQEYESEVFEGVIQAIRPGTVSLAGRTFKVSITNSSSFTVKQGGKFVAVDQDTNQTFDGTLDRLPPGSKWEKQYVFNANFPDKWAFNATAEEDPDVGWTGFGLRARPSGFGSVTLNLADEA